MHSFFRVVRAALRYRFTLAAAMLCSLAIGVLWGGNIGALYPFVEVIFQGKSLQESLESKIATAKEAFQKLSADIEDLERQVAQAEGDQQAKLQLEIAAAQSRLVAEQRAVAAGERYIPYVDRYFPHDPFATLLLVIGVLMLGTALKSLFLVLNVVLIARVVQSTMVDLQNEFFRRTLQQDLAVFRKQGTSSLVGRFVNQMRMMGDALAAFFGAAVREPLKMVACLVGAAIISWRLLLLSMICAPIGILLLRLLATTIKRTTQRSLNLLAEQIRRLTESYGGFVTVKAYNLQSQERLRFRRITLEISWMRQKLSFLFSLSKPISEVMAIAITSVAILAGAYLVLHRETHLFGIRLTERPLDPVALKVFFGLLAGLHLGGGV